MITMRDLFYIAVIVTWTPALIHGQSILGSVRPNTNTALPASYGFMEYVFPEPADQGVCRGQKNASTLLRGIFFAQTHRLSVDHPYFFLTGYRPALLQVAVTGQGPSPDIQVEGLRNGNSLGGLCLKGPALLPGEIDLKVPGFEKYFTVTLPGEWIRPGTELIVKYGDQSKKLSSDMLKIGPYTELNLVQYDLELLDYPGEPNKIIDHLLAEIASACPASVIRMGKFPVKLEFPEVIANNDREQLVRLKSRRLMAGNNIFSDGYINSVATQFLYNLHRSTQDYLSTFYFGNTLNLKPGGWGGAKSFVGFDYDDVFIHEMGHAFSLPHWGLAYGIPNPAEWDYIYPYGGDTGDGGGRGESWTFLQHLYEFVNPVCQYDARGKAGWEASDAMQRNNHCLQARSYGPGPWDGFGDFSALAMSRYLAGSDELYQGTVSYRGNPIPFQFNRQPGFPILTLENGQRTYRRDPLQPQAMVYEEQMLVLGNEKPNTPVYLIYGSAHETQTQANIIYKPVKFTGTLPPVVDPTDPATFNKIKSASWRPFFEQPRDITLKMTYADGSVLHAVNPYHSYTRTADYQWGYHIWRNDICHFSLVVPGNKELIKVELFNRPLVARDAGDPIRGNINNASQNITSGNFMNGATLQAVYPGERPLALNSIGDLVWHDLNRNGKEDFGEPGIPGVTLLLWEDSDDDKIPDYLGYKGSTVTDSGGRYRFEGLLPGHYLVFVWSLENWNPGQALHGMVSTKAVSDPNTDIDSDNNGRPGIPFGLTGQDIVSGIIDLTADGEPLDDHDRPSGWFDYNPSGNMSVDFGFYFPAGCPVINAYLLGTDSLCVQENGNLTVDPASGTGPFSYTWQDGSNTAVRTDILPGKYLVTLTDSKNCTGVASKEVFLRTATNCQTTSIQPDAAPQPEIWPNPFLSKIRVSNPSGRGVSLRLIDMMGIALYGVKLTGIQTEIDLNWLPTGIYVLILSDSNNQVIKLEKMVKR